MRRFGSFGHLVRRFFGMLDPRGPGAGDEGWVREELSAGEVSLWERMSGPDRRHAVAVARRVATRTGDRQATAAALLHDVGKIEAGLGPVRRAVATVAGAIAPARASAGDGRVARYLTHDRRGAALLEAAGAGRLAITWAREHHLPRERWTVPPELGTILKAADDD